jgi:signal transduction histidine kinase
MYLTSELESLAADAPMPRKVGARLEAAHQLAGSIARSLRDLARGLRPSSLDDLGPVPSLRRLVTDFGERNKVAATFAASGPQARLGQTTELAMYRIAQEALTNVERHSACRTVTVADSAAQLGDGETGSEADLQDPVAGLHIEQRHH